MNKKAFTLVELLAAIVILSIVLVIVIPSVSNAIEQSRTKAYEANEKNMITAARTYVVDNVNKMPSVVGDALSVELSTLVNEKLIKRVRDAKENDLYCDGRVLIYKTGTKKYTYYAYLDCGDNYKTSSTFIDANNIILDISSVYNSGTNNYTITISVNTNSNATYLNTPTSTIAVSSTMTYNVSEQGIYEFNFSRSDGKVLYFDYEVD